MWPPSRHRRGGDGVRRDGGAGPRRPHLQRVGGAAARGHWAMCSSRAPTTPSPPPTSPGGTSPTRPTRSRATCGTESGRFLIDVHYGVRDPANGRVRTDLAAEGSDRNKVAEQLPASALRVADRVAGGIGLGRLTGTSEPYLCHTAVRARGRAPGAGTGGDRELPEERPGAGAGRDRRGLRPTVDDRKGLRRRRAHAIRRDAARRMRGSRRSGSWSTATAGCLCSPRRRGGSPSWYMPAFDFIQDTPLGALHPGQLSCARYRGTSAQSAAADQPLGPSVPAEPDPQRPDRARRLPARADRAVHAERGIHGAIVAVDFYERTAVVDVARELNSER